MRFRQAGKYIMAKLSKELPATLSYHGIDHVLDVYAAAERLGTQESISDHQMKLLLTAAWYHDAGFLTGAKDHEEASCAMVSQVLPGFGYSDSDIAAICGMIMATRIPQHPQNHLEQIMADADLDYLGRDDFFIIGDKLYREFLTSGVVNDHEEWDRLQARFLESHQYFTASAKISRQAKKEAHLQQVKAKLKT